MKAIGILALFATLFTSNVARAECAKPSTLAELAASGQEGEKAFSDMNLEQLLVHSTRAREVIVPCLSEKVRVKDAAGFHRLMALEAFTHKRTDRVIAEFHAARMLEPGYQLLLEVAPADHRLRALYERAAFADEGKLEPVYPPIGGYILVAGVRNAGRPSKTPVIIQVFGPMEKLLETRYVQPGESLPSWGKNPFGLTAKDLGLGKSVWVEPKTWYISSGAAALLTVAFYSVALYNKSQFSNTSARDTTNSDRDLQGYADRANGFGVATIATGAVALVLTGVGAGFQFGVSDDSSKKEQP